MKFSKNWNHHLDSVGRNFGWRPKDSHSFKQPPRIRIQFAGFWAPKTGKKKHPICEWRQPLSTASQGMYLKVSKIKSLGLLVGTLPTSNCYLSWKIGWKASKLFFRSFTLGFYITLDVSKKFRVPFFESMGHPYIRLLLPKPLCMWRTFWEVASSTTCTLIHAISHWI